MGLGLYTSSTLLYPREACCVLQHSHKHFNDEEEEEKAERTLTIFPS